MRRAAVCAVVVGLAWVWSPFVPSVFSQVDNARLQRLFAPSDSAVQERTFRVRLRVELENPSFSPLRGVAVTRAIFRDWPEQSVEELSEVQSHGLTARTSLLDGLVRRLHLRAPILRGVEDYVLECKVTRRRLEFDPEELSQWRVAVGSKVARWRTPSPGIESRDPAIRSLCEQLDQPSAAAWHRVERFFQFVRQEVRYRQQPFKGAVAALRSKDGDCEDKAALFIALCRAAGIPARTVWGASHAWAEVALRDDDGKVRWVPCDPTREDRPGRLTSFFPIYQKGDRFRLPELRGKPVRYVMPLCIARSGRPAFQVRDELLEVDGEKLDPPFVMQLYKYSQ